MDYSNITSEEFWKKVKNLPEEDRVLWKQNVKNVLLKAYYEQGIFGYSIKLIENEEMAEYEDLDIDGLDLEKVFPFFWINITYEKGSTFEGGLKTFQINHGLEIWD